jgi:hypothetical protein
VRKFTNQLQIRSWRKTSWVWYTRKYETCARRIAAECAIRSTFKPESNADCLWHKQLYPEQAPANQFWVKLLRNDWITDLHQPLRLNLNSLGQPCTCLSCHFRKTTRWWIARFRNRGFERNWMHNCISSSWDRHTTYIVPPPKLLQTPPAWTKAMLPAQPSASSVGDGRQWSGA